MAAKKQIYLIRHGQTDYNKKGIVQGSGIDSDLNEEGIHQALQFFRAYFHVPFGKIYTSELKRTIQTVAPFMMKPMINQERLPGLNEISWGVVEGKIMSDFHGTLFDSVLNDWRNGMLDSRVDGGESPNQMKKRQLDALQYIMDDNKLLDLPSLICTHGRAMRSMLCVLTGKCLSEMDDFVHSNLSLYILEGSEIGKFDIITFNSLEHLDI